MNKTKATSVFKVKKAFIENEFSTMLKRIDYTVIRCLYEGSPEAETVTVDFNSGYSRKINVWGDSLAGMARDVLKNI